MSRVNKDFALKFVPKVPIVWKKNIIMINISTHLSREEDTFN